MSAKCVSVIIPAHDGERFIGQAIDSATSQDYQPIDIIVIDDGSTDRTAEIIKAFDHVQYRRLDPMGASAARNAGIEIARGDFIAFLDQDDLWPPEKTRLQVEHMNANPDIGYCIGHQQIFLEPGTSIPAWLRSRYLEGKQTGYLPGTMLVRRALFEQIGPFNAELEAAGDVEWFFRAKDLGIPAAILPDVLLHRRIHESNHSNQVEALHAEYLKIARLSVKRGRKHAK